MVYLLFLTHVTWVFLMKRSRDLLRTAFYARDLLSWYSREVSAIVRFEKKAYLLLKLFAKRSWVSSKKKRIVKRAFCSSWFFFASSPQMMRDLVKRGESCSFFKKKLVSFEEGGSRLLQNFLLAIVPSSFVIKPSLPFFPFFQSYHCICMYFMYLVRY